MPNKILVVEDNEDLAKLIALHLTDIQCEAEIVDDGLRAVARANSGDFSAVILDVMLPSLDGFEVCKRIRAAQNFVPVIMLTSRDSEIDRVLGLEIGADDYLTKPFSVRELQARIKALVRRTQVFSGAAAADASSSVVTLAGLVIDATKRTVTRDSQPIALTAKEFDLLLYLAQHPGQVFSRTQLLDGVWGYSHAGYEHTVNSHINRLRNKLESDPANPRYVMTAWGVGYHFAAE